jgi:hypothetical protein
MTSYTISIPYNDFREYMVETDESGPWGDAYFHETFDKHLENDEIRIEYKYGDYENGKSEIKWRVIDTEKVYRVRYGGSSVFAMWWCGLTDEEEEEEDFGKCIDCSVKLSGDDCGDRCADCLEQEDE